MENLQQFALPRIWSTAPTSMQGWGWLEVPGMRTDKQGNGRASVEPGHGIDGGSSGGSWMRIKPVAKFEAHPYPSRMIHNPQLIPLDLAPKI